MNCQRHAFQVDEVALKDKKLINPNPNVPNLVTPHPASTNSHHRLKMYRENDDNELPDQVIVDIHRILQINNADTSDPLDVLSNNFSPLDVLNDFFPDGTIYIAIHSLFSILTLHVEASLGQIDSVQAQLAQTELQLQQEINELQNELRKDQDPDRMMIIQEMISVRLFPSLASHLTRLKLRTRRTSSHRCHSYAKRLLSRRRWLGISRKISKSWTLRRRTSFSV